jgi:hypothetical protein
MNRIAELYVKLVLSLGQHDPDYVDAYYGPEEWRSEVRSSRKSLPRIKSDAELLLAELSHFSIKGAEELILLRHLYLTKQIQALIARADMLEGKKLPFDDEAHELYDARPPAKPEREFDDTLRAIDLLLEGNGSLIERYDAYKKKFIIPAGKLDEIFSVAIAECRARTKTHLSLPAQESFSIEYVKNKSWSGYNWYKGSNQSVIQINTDLPITIDRVIDLAAHEGYPGHHVYNSLLEEYLVKGRKWVEFSVYALFSPQSTIAEGTANFGIEVAFPGKERLEFERALLFPMAGLDPQSAEEYYKVFDLVAKLSYAGNEAARRYLNGLSSRDETVVWLMKYALMPRERAEQRVKFFDQYRSYVINYNVGLDLVRAYVDRHGGTTENPERRWKEFARLLSSPRVPSSLVV